MRPPGARTVRVAAAPLLVALLLGLAASRAGAQIVIDNRPLAAADVATTAPLFASGSPGSGPPVGRVAFAWPQVRIAAAMHLVVPARVPRAFRVYWVEFAFSLQGVNLTSATSMTFQVEAPHGCTALDLVPFLVTDASLGRAARGAAAERAGSIPIGNVLSQQVRYRTLAATILALGVQENTFSWTLTDRALAWAPKRLAAVMAIPRGRTRLPLVLTVTLHERAAGSGDRVWMARTAAPVTAPLDGSRAR